jgi:hypothetical protein
MAKSYIDKYVGVDRNSVYDILKKVGTTEYKNGVKKEYKAVGIAQVKINENTFTNYGQYRFIWEKTYPKSPDRSADGRIGNLNSYATFLTPHLIMDFSVMSIDDYREIMLLHYSANEFTVECYDPIYNHTIKVKMYFATEEMAKLYTIAQNRLLPDGQWEEWVDLVGVTDYSVELIGTNNDLDLVSVRYIVNPPQVTENGVTTTLVPDFATDGGEDDVYKGEEFVIGGNTDIPNETFGGKYKFTYWNISAENPTTPKTQGVYPNGYAYTINSDLVLYAQWESTSSHTLTYNYGLADPVINDSEYTYVTSKTVVKGKSIGELPTAEIPIVKAKDINGVEREYKPYYGGKWYKTPIRYIGSVEVTKDTPYWLDRDATIYLLYKTNMYSLGLYLDGALFSSSAPEYNAVLNLPILVQSGKKFDGWYYTSDYKEGTKFNGNMPPYSLNLYARFIDE